MTTNIDDVRAHLMAQGWAEHPWGREFLIRKGHIFEASLRLVPMRPNRPQFGVSIKFADIVGDEVHVFPRLGGKAFQYRSEGDDLEVLLAEAVAEFDRLERVYADQIRSEIVALQAEARQASRKPGWVWYQIRDDYGPYIASEFLPK